MQSFSFATASERNGGGSCRVSYGRGARNYAWTAIPLQASNDARRGRRRFGRWSWARSAQHDNGCSSDSEEMATPSAQECAHHIRASPERLLVRVTDAYFVSCSSALAPELSLREGSSSRQSRLVGKLDPLSVETVKCQICFDSVREDHVSAPKCCRAKVCTSCAKSMVAVNVSEGY